MTQAGGFPGALGQLADLADIRGAAAIASDLRRAASAIGALPRAELEEFEQRACGGRLGFGGGFSSTIVTRLHDLATDGADQSVRAALTTIPAVLGRLVHLEAVTTADALRLVRQTGVLTLDDLRTVLESGRIDAAMGGAVAGRLRTVADSLARGFRTLPLGRAWDLLDDLGEQIRAVCPAVSLLVVSGDARRMEPMTGPPVLVGRAPDPPAALDVITSMPGVEDVRHRGPRRAILWTRQAEVDIRVATPDDYGTALFRATGSPSHVAAVERRRSALRIARREEDVYAHAGLPYIPPELRQGVGEVEAAATAAPPRLVTQNDIRGDLHMHSTYSDGRDTLDAMVGQCMALGYEYIAMTDHSERAGASRTVTIELLARQRDEIARLRERYRQLAILHGIEVDVMPDGRLDFPDRVLEPLDIVLASVHDSAHQDARGLTARCLQAIRHPLVTILTHPGNRIVGRRAPYPLDYAAVYAAAAETGTALEIDGAPMHLDLDGDQARAAIGAGATVVIDSDAHRAAALARQMHFGVGTARRGLVEPRHVLNARPLAEVRRFIAAKRRR
ncbi:DNA polymerase/3'-5' exonuclease PolX [soil metagenome]